ncbi:hypothetical protein Taro_045513 [Colocasia esculenta]|uniref:Uncharacterized protein n=1 Tax=Colocasia esculenta TaxID=4460 RepID=A0A843WMA3_COLES|nr:hypothetical protein [Colocasia esculenta]
MNDEDPIKEEDSKVDDATEKYASGVRRFDEPTTAVDEPNGCVLQIQVLSNATRAIVTRDESAICIAWACQSRRYANRGSVHDSAPLGHWVANRQRECTPFGGIPSIRRDRQNRIGTMKSNRWYDRIGGMKLNQ